MLWLAVHLPWLSLEAYSATLSEAEQALPLALLAEHRIAVVNAAAAHAGVQPGLKRATALALAPELLIGQADAARDAQALQAVAHAALAFTPAVALEGPVVLLEVQSCLRYFGGPQALQARLLEALAPLGHRVQLASAPTALGAALLSRWREGLAWGPHSTRLEALQALLDAAPVWLLGPGRAHWEALQGMGLRNLSDLRALPRAGLARRFGEALLNDLDRARGDAPDPRPWLSAPERFAARLELAMRADRTEQVLHAAAILLARLVAWARARQSRVAAFTLRMKHEVRHREGEATPQASALRVALAEPSHDAAHLQLLLRERLSNCQLAGPTLELELRCNELAAGAVPNGELFPTRQGERAGLARLLERLRARLGDAQVQRLQTVADHRPERACHGAAELRDVPAAAPALNDMLPLTRPAWLLPEPLPLAERSTLPLFEGRPLQLLAGPERIETGWWDAALVARDYFVAQDHDGSLLWVYRERLPHADTGAAPWFLQGRFG